MHVYNLNKNQNCGSKRWWSLVNNVTGHANSEVPLSSIFGIRIPELSVYTVCQLLLTQTASRPDDLPYWFWNK